MAPEEFEEWHELFKAKLLSQDGQWAKVLEVMEKMKETEFDEAVFAKEMVDQPLKEKARKEANSAL